MAANLDGFITELTDLIIFQKNAYSLMLSHNGGDNITEMSFLLSDGGVENVFTRYIHGYMEGSHDLQILCRIVRNDVPATEFYRSPSDVEDFSNWELKETSFIYHNNTVEVDMSLPIIEDTILPDILDILTAVIHYETPHPKYLMMGDPTNLDHWCS